MSDGTHEVELRVTDAAGNTTLVGDHTLTTENEVQPSSFGTRGRPAPAPPAPAPAPCNGACDSAPRLVLAPTATTSTARTLRWRYSALAVGGLLLTHAGAPIAGAQVQLLSQPSALGAAQSAIATTTTAADGTWHFTVPAGPSRTLTVTYRTRLGDPNPAAQLAVHETVSAAVSLRAPKTTRLGRRIAMRGSLSGGFIPSGGALVAMQIYFRGDWRTIDVVHTNAHGQFTYPYVFAGVTVGPWRVRALVPAQAAYPFTQSESRPVTIDVRS